MQSSIAFTTKEMRDRKAARRHGAVGHHMPTTYTYVTHSETIK